MIVILQGQADAPAHALLDAQGVTQPFHEPGHVAPDPVIVNGTRQSSPTLQELDVPWSATWARHGSRESSPWLPDRGKVGDHVLKETVTLAVETLRDRFGEQSCGEATRRHP